MDGKDSKVCKGNIQIDNYEGVKPLGPSMTQGGSVTYRTYKDYIRTAVKIVNIGEKAKEARVDPEVAIKNLENEITILSRLRHPNIVRIIDFGSVPLGSVSISTCFYLAMEFVPGKNIITTIEDKLRSKAGLDQGIMVRILESLLEAVSYMHSSGVTHLDIKPDNVLVNITENNEVQVTIIDVGSSVIIDKNRFKEMESKISVEKDENILKQIEEKNDEDVLYVKFDATGLPSNISKYSGSFEKRGDIRQKLFPLKDLISLARIFNEIASLLSKKDTFRRDFVEGLRTISKMMSSSSGHYNPETSFSLTLDALGLIRKLDPAFLSTVEVPELSSEGAQKIDVMLNEGLVPFSWRMERILHHPLVQRLNFITQLDLDYLLYPDARHSRISHSMLTFHYMRLALLSLMEDLNFRLNIEKEEIEAILIYAFLHDIGHYPLSHAFEDYAEDDPQVKSDDDLFPIIYSSFEAYGSGKNIPQFDSISKVVADIFGPVVSNKIEIIAMLCNPPNISTLNELKRFEGDLKTKISERENIMLRFLSGLISSSIDTDKVAYLTHDATISGARYGSSINMHYYPSILKFPGYDRLKSFWNQVNKQNEGRIKDKMKPLTTIVSIRDSGIATAEAIIISRYWMVSRVYWHRTNRSLTSVLKFVIGMLNDIYNKSSENFFEAYFKETFYYSETQAMSWLSNKFNKQIIENETMNGKRFYNPLEPISERREWKSIYFRFHAYQKMGKDQGIYDYLIRILEMGCLFELTVRVTDKISELFKDRLSNYVGDIIYKEGSEPHLKYGTILFDITRKKRDVIATQNIMIDRSGHAYGKDDALIDDLGQVSKLIGYGGKGLSEEFVQEAKKFRVFFHSDLMEIIRKRDTENFSSNSNPTSFSESIMEILDNAITDLYWETTEKEKWKSCVNAKSVLGQLQEK